MVLSVPWVDSLDMIPLHPVRQIVRLNPMGLSSPWGESIEIIPLHPLNIARNEPNGP